MIGIRYMVRIIIADHQLSPYVATEDMILTVADKLNAAYWYVRWFILILSFLFWCWPQSPHQKLHYCKTSRWMPLVNFIRFYDTWILMHGYDEPNL